MNKNAEELKELRDDAEKLQDEQNKNIKAIEEIKGVIDSTKKQLAEIKRELKTIVFEKNEANRQLVIYNYAQEELAALNKTQEKLLTTVDPRELTDSTLQENLKSFTLFIKLFECIIGMLAFFTTVATGNVIPFVIVAVLMVTDFAINISPLKKYTDKLIFKVYKEKKYREFSKLIDKQKIILYNLTTELPDITKRLEQLNNQESELLKSKTNLEQDLDQLEQILTDYISKNDQAQNELAAINQELEYSESENTIDSMIDSQKPKKDKVYVKTNRNSTLERVSHNG